MRLIQENGRKICYLEDSSRWYDSIEQTRAFLDFKETQEYKTYAVEPEFNLFKENAESIVSEHFKEDRYNIVDIGSGDGCSTLNTVDILKDNSQIIYIPIDSSSHMIQEAIQNSKERKITTIDTKPCSFEDGVKARGLIDLSPYEHSKFFFLGSTFLNYAPDNILLQLKKLMNPRDTLCVGITLIDQKIYDVMRPYEEARGEDEFFSLLLKKLGIDREEMKFYERKYEGKGESCYEFKSSKAISVEGKVINFNPGDLLIAAYSFIYTPELIQETVRRHFPLSRFYFNKEKEYCIFISEL